MPVITIGIAAKSRCSAKLWQMLHNHAMPGIPVKTDINAPPSAPWCAARIEGGLAHYPGAAAWLGDFERCLAWAWIEGAGP
jgi:hypothetical protein